MALILALAVTVAIIMVVAMLVEMRPGVQGSLTGVLMDALVGIRDAKRLSETPCFLAIALYVEVATPPANIV